VGHGEEHDVAGVLGVHADDDVLATHSAAEVLDVGAAAAPQVAPLVDDCREAQQRLIISNNTPDAARNPLAGGSGIEFAKMRHVGEACRNAAPTVQLAGASE